MRGKNPIRKPLKGDGNQLEIQEIFPTIQGEGPRSGEPAIFIRLGGCNLACDFCDTEFESFSSMNIEEIHKQVLSFSRNTNLIVITGGEPFRQPIEKLCSLLLENNFNIQIETNGTLYRPVDERVEIVCSPKNTGNINTKTGGCTEIRDDLLQRLTALKFLVSKYDKNYIKIPEVGQSKYNTPVFVQPMDEYDDGKNRANMNYACEIVQKYGYKLSLQIHKILRMP